MAASLARADAAVLLPPSGDESLRVAQAAAHAALQNELLDQGLRVLSHEDAVAEAQSEAARSCKQVDCAGLLARECGAQYAVGLAVWASAEIKTVFVTLVDQQGHRFPGHAVVDKLDYAAATRAALLDARSLTLLGPGPWIHVHGEPKGAQVVLGGKVIGTTPLRQKIDSGRYVLEVRKDRHKSFVQSIDVPPNSAKQVDIEVSLQLRPEAGHDIDRTSLTAIDTAEGPEGVERSTTWSFVVGGILAAAGAASLAYGIVTLSQDGDCAERDSMGRCRQEVQAGTKTTLALIGGGIGLAGATVMFIVQPIQTESGETAILTGVRGNL